jgi:predicted Zn-dependent protease
VLHHALGLTLVRMKRTDEAIGELERAAALDPGNARFLYVYAVALHSTGKAMQRLQGLRKRLWPIPTTAIFSRPWQVSIKRVASTRRRIVTPSG